MIITPAHVNAWRARTQWVLRGVAFLLIASGSYLCLKRIVFGVITGDFRMVTRVWTQFGETATMSRGVAMLLVGVGIAVFGRRLSRWIITLPPNTCPRCGHVRTLGGGTKCTECGLEGVNSET